MTSNTNTPSDKWYYECNDCTKKFAKDYDMPSFNKNMEKPKDKYNLILSSIFSTNLFCMTCSHDHAHRVYYKIGNPEPYNLEFIRE